MRCDVREPVISGPGYRIGQSRLGDPVGFTRLMRIVSSTLRLLTALVPLALTPLFAHLISNGVLNFGGGCKDIVLVLPWILWSVLYLIASVVLWIRKVRLGWALLVAAAFSTGLLLISFFGLYFFGKASLGVH